MGKRHGSNLFGRSKFPRLVGSTVGYLGEAAKIAGAAAAQYAIDRGLIYGQKYLNSGSQTMTQTQNKTPNETRRLKKFVRGQATTGYLAGKLRARRSARSFKKRGRRYRRKSVRRLNGVSYQTEFASFAAGDKCIYVGHTTALPDEILRVLIMACFKKVLIEFGITFSSWPQSRTGYLLNNDIFQFVYKDNPLGNPQSTGFSLTVVAGHVTFWDVVSNLFSIVKGTLVGSTVGDGLILTEIQFIRSNNITKVDLQDAMVDIFVKSALKIQNRSVAAAGDDELDVNNVPVYGKLYQGKGNGALQRSVDNVSFLNGAATGNNVNIDGSTFANFAEPPHPAEFTHVNRYTKVFVNPGHIKTNVLTFKTKINITNLFIKIYKYYWNNQTSDWFNLGVFSMFGIERVIAKLGGEASPGINVTYEIDNKFFCNIYPAPQKFTTPMRVVS